MMRGMALFLVLAASHASADASLNQFGANPIEKVIEMMSELQQKIIKEGEAEQKAYDEFAEWCEEESKNLQFEIKTAQGEVEDLKATISKAESDIKVNDENIEELSSSIATDTKDLEDATLIREKEHTDFLAEEADLVDSVDTIGRAIAIIEREMAKGGAALVQIQNAKSLIDSLHLLVEASAISNQDSTKLTSLIQNQHKADDEDEELGAPDPAAYKNQSGGIVDALNKLLEDAEAQLAEARKKEQTTQYNYDMLKQSLEDSIANANKEMDKAKKAKAAAAETKATAEGELAVTQKDLAEDQKLLAETHQECMTKAEDFELGTQSRGEELKAIATAKKIIIETTGGATSQSYDLVETSVDFLQMGSSSRLSSRSAANFHAVKYVKDLAHRMNSAALLQLANRMAVATRMGSAAGEDPFEKVKGLISEMIERLIKEAEEDAAKKAYCDKEMGETKAKKEELTDEIEALTTKIDKMSSDSAKLKEEVAVLSKELADLEKSQIEMDKMRAEEKAAWEKNSAEMEQGVEGVKLALKVLRDYYAKESKGSHKKASGAGGGIISMLEVVESDFTKGLAEMNQAEELAAAEYEKTTKENEIAKTTKEQDVKYKTKEAKSLDTAVAEATSDRDGLQTELDAVLEYWDKITEECVAKPEPYEERKKRREAEIAGLKEALAILEGEAALLQQSVVTRRSTLRGVVQHVA